MVNLAFICMLLYTADTQNIVCHIKIIVTFFSWPNSCFSCVIMVVPFRSSTLCTYFSGSVTQRLWRDLSDLHIPHGKKKRENGRAKEHMRWWTPVVTCMFCSAAVTQSFLKFILSGQVCGCACVYLCVWASQRIDAHDRRKNSGLFSAHQSEC